MPAFLIPLAGLALGALGQLFRKQRSLQALSQASATATADTPSETGLSTAASSDSASPVAQQQSAESAAQDPSQNQTGTGGDPVSATQPATGPVQQNQGGDSPTPAQGQDAGLAARLGAEKAAESRRKNRSQQASVSNAALS